ncbi:MAG: DNA photolyase FAD-binding protein [Wenzhouxiangellaceae bacterium]|nr:DNA photolyase FAD-binding protein [Wenzhouxiangellaceae bacterium]MBS3824033.1 DNA photolyase FAD-binding protein [Wenzhouxiangellaceae bacterium]
MSDSLPNALELFPPTRAAALERLEDFVPRSGRKYASSRNADPGPGLRDNVSMLSPYLRHRVITEHEVVAAVLQEYAPSTAGKFIQEVFWRTYWKGWLQMRPQVWHDYLAERDEARARWEENAGRRKAWSDAEAGRTGIECFDDWVAELKATGYLHNHVRMWFASIWIFTLRLPWSLGADFFLRHLVDGDPASNTLGWRWVAGIQTPGKTYLARPGNIEKFTGGRYRPAGLATEAPAIREESPPQRQPIAPADGVPEGSRVLVLVHGDDLRAFDALPGGLKVAAVVVAREGHSDTPWPFGDKAGAFVAAAAEDAARQAESTLDAPVEVIDGLDSGVLAERAKAAGADAIVTADAPVGPVDDGLGEVSEEIAGSGLELRRVRRAWDEHAWPHATRGFFPFKKKIPALLEQAGLA